MNELTDDKLREVVMDLWMKNPKMGQNKIAEAIGVSTFTFRKFIKGEVKNLKMTTKLRILVWINTMTAVEGEK